MELSKQGFLNIHFDTDPLTKNFKAIQLQFGHVHQVIKQLKLNNTTLKQKMQKQIEIQIKKQLNPKKQIGKKVLNKTIKKQENKKNQQNQQGNQNHSNSSDRLQEDVISEINQQQIDNEQDQNNLAFKDIINLKEHEQMTLSQENTQKRIQSKQNNKTLTMNSKNQNNKKLLKKNNPTSNSQLLLQIQQVRKKINEINFNENLFKQQITNLEKQNQIFRNALGMKKKVSNIIKPSSNNTSKTKNNLDSNGSKKSISSKSKIEGQENINLIQEQDVCTPFKDIYEDINKIREYLNGKMKAIDNNFLQVNTKIQHIERNVDILQRTDDSLKQDISCLERTCNQTKLNIGQLNDKTMIAMTSNKRSKKTLAGSILNDENTSIDQEKIQNRIIELLDQMEQIKADYHQLLFGKNTEVQDTSQKQLSPQMLERRKRLATKLNASSNLDDKMKKDLSHCRRDLKKLREQFDYLMNGVNSGSNQIKTLIIKPNQTKQDWKSLSTKIYKAKQQLQSQIKQLQGKITSNNQLSVVLNQLQVGIQECKIILKKKIDIVEFEKTTKRIQNKLNNFIKQTFQKEGYTNQNDALIAKQPWFCLSCDVELKTYTAKVNKNGPSISNAGDKFVGKKVNPQTHMVRRNQNGRLPSLAI